MRAAYLHSRGALSGRWRLFGLVPKVLGQKVDFPKVLAELMEEPVIYKLLVFKPYVHSGLLPVVQVLVQHDVFVMGVYFELQGTVGDLNIEHLLYLFQKLEIWLPNP